MPGLAEAGPMPECDRAMTISAPSARNCGTWAAAACRMSRVTTLSPRSWRSHTAVCGGISLEYYFSFVDNERYGCGTKLPHNVTGLMGVMNGYESDLRTGLPLQMVEIHEPVRILFVVETSPERALETMRKNLLVWEFLENRWIRLAVLDPNGGPPLLYRDGEWDPVEGDDEGLPVARSSAAWYAGKREHLPIAQIPETAEWVLTS